VGAKLVAARKATQKNRKQAATDLCIREDYLKALENNDSANLPPSPYDLGFLRQYARYLELDVEPLVAEYKASRMLNFETNDLPHQHLEENAIWHSKWLLWALGGIALIILIAAWVLDGAQEAATAVPAVEASTTVLPQPDEAVALQVVTPKGDVPAAEAPPKTDAATAPTDAPVQPTPVAVAEVAKPVVSAVDPQRKPLPALQAIKPEGARVRLEAASEDAWILIRPLHRDRTYVARSLPKGSSYWVTPWQNIALDAARPELIGVYVDGEYKGLIGPAGKEIAGLSLSPEALKAYFSKGENLTNTPVKNPSVEKR
jgi:cytoskeleton protein RodZ